MELVDRLGGVTVDVPDTVSYEYEIEVKQGGKSEIEVKLAWK